MKKNQLIKKEIDNTEESISELDYSSWFILGISIFLWLTSFYVGSLLASYYPMISVPLCLTGFGLPILGAHDCFTKRSKIKYQKLYLKHLENIVENGVDKSTENIDVRRLNAIERHNNVIDLNKKRTTFNTIVSSLSILSWVIGAVISYFTPVGALASAIGLTCLGGVSFKSYKENQVVEEEKMRIKSIRSDLIYGTLYPKKMDDLNDKTITKNSDNMHAVVDKQDSIADERLEQLAEEYVRELANSHAHEELDVLSGYKGPYVKK